MPLHLLLLLLLVAVVAAIVATARCTDHRLQIDAETLSARNAAAANVHDRCLECCDQKPMLTRLEPWLRIPEHVVELELLQKGDRHQPVR
uniref:Putative secreted protein n=1 Tax=Anopheles darlingi TaxID=43151 RepID=A0A2M4DL25_ANODA